MTHQEAEALRIQDRYWKLWIIYGCRADPRVIVRNRFVVGWTWNFGHPLVFPSMILFVTAFLGPLALLLWLGVVNPVPILAVAAAEMIGLIAVAHRIASGPH